VTGGTDTDPWVEARSIYPQNKVAAEKKLRLADMTRREAYDTRPMGILLATPCCKKEGRRE